MCNSGPVPLVAAEPNRLRHLHELIKEHGGLVSKKCPQQLENTTLRTASQQHEETLEPRHTDNVPVWGLNEIEDDETSDESRAPENRRKELKQSWLKLCEQVVQETSPFSSVEVLQDGFDFQGRDPTPLMNVVLEHCKQVPENLRTFGVLKFGNMLVHSQGMKSLLTQES